MCCEKNFAGREGHSHAAGSRQWLRRTHALFLKAYAPSRFSVIIEGRASSGAKIVAHVWHARLLLRVGFYRRIRHGKLKG